MDTERSGFVDALYTAGVSGPWKRLLSWYEREARPTRRARAAEVKGELERAAELYVEAKLDDEAARVLSTLAERTEDALERLELLGRARDFSTGEQRRRLSRRCAKQRLELCKKRVVRLTSIELDELANELLRLEEPALAAEAHALAGNVEDQARALVEAGAIESLEEVLEADREKTERALESRRRALVAHDLEKSGRRREALAMARTNPDDPVLRELIRRVEGNRVLGPRIVLDWFGTRKRFALGREISLGRAGATIEIPSPAVSRSHLLLSRDASGPSVRDVSRNGTTLLGVAVDTSLGIREALTLELGGEVTVRLAPDPDFGVRVELLDSVWFVPLGPLRSPVGVLDLGDDGWLELSPAGAKVHLGELRVVHTVELCRGDRLSLARGGPVVLGVES